MYYVCRFRIPSFDRSRRKDKPYKVADGDGLFAQVAASGSALWRWLGHIFADDGYAGPKLRGGLDHIGEWTIEIVKRTDANAGFADGLVLAERGGRGAPSASGGGTGIGLAYKIGM